MRPPACCTSDDTDLHMYVCTTVHRTRDRAFAVCHRKGLRAWSAVGTHEEIGQDKKEMRDHRQLPHLFSPPPPRPKRNMDCVVVCIFKYGYAILHPVMLSKLLEIGAHTTLLPISADCVRPVGGGFGYVHTYMHSIR